MTAEQVAQLATIMLSLRRAHANKDFAELRELSYQLIELCEEVMDINVLRELWASECDE